MAQQYQVRKGYVWIGPDGKPTGQTVVSDRDPGFKGQEYKLEPLVNDDQIKKPAPRQAEAQEETDEDQQRDFSAQENRMLGKAKVRR